MWRFDGSWFSYPWTSRRVLDRICYLIKSLRIGHESWLPTPNDRLNAYLPQPQEFYPPAVSLTHFTFEKSHRRLVISRLSWVRGIHWNDGEERECSGIQIMAVGNLLVTVHPRRTPLDRPLVTGPGITSEKVRDQGSPQPHSVASTAKQRSFWFLRQTSPV